MCWLMTEMDMKNGDTELANFNTNKTLFDMCTARNLHDTINLFYTHAASIDDQPYSHQRQVDK